VSESDYYEKVGSLTVAVCTSGPYKGKWLIYRKYKIARTEYYNHAANMFLELTEEDSKPAHAWRYLYDSKEEAMTAAKGLMIITEVLGE